MLDGRYRIIRSIGVGGTGVVFEAVYDGDGSAVAIKTLRPRFLNHPDLARRLVREAEVAQRVRHPGVVRIFDQGVLSDGSPYLVMPLLRGESLAQVLLRTGRLSEVEVAVMASRVAAALHSAHCSGYVHRDIKPEHVLFDRTPLGDLAVQLLDFGVCASESAPRDERAREHGKVFGTPSYVSPEQASGREDVDARADLFGLGIVMFECLTGTVPFRGPTISKLLLRIIREQAPRVREVVPQVDSGMDELVFRLLQREADERLPSARALARALAPLVGDRKAVERTFAADLQLSGEPSEDVPTIRRQAVA